MIGHDCRSGGPPAGPGAACGECPAAAAGRRAFLRDVAFAAAGALVLTGGSAARALAASVAPVQPAGASGTQRTYPIPARDAIQVDASNDLILARWQGKVYAFSLRCPHRGARLEWRENEGRVFCPKHKARFAPDGTHDSGRESRDLDRYEIARQGASVTVDLGAVLHADQDADAWRAAVITVA
ncbi:MAG: Rieske (2Fe-2S) protein [Gemmatimonadaceae bacterium]|nr:Rieske (2Fe-2S) protein [Gemmatimonadaceae bacterium]